MSLIPSYIANAASELVADTAQERGQEQTTLAQHPRAAQQGVWASTNGEEMHHKGELPPTLGRDGGWGKEIPSAAASRTDTAATPNNIATRRILHPFARLKLCSHAGLSTSFAVIIRTMLTIISIALTTTTQRVLH